MYVSDNSEARSSKHCCHLTVMSMTYSVCVFVCVALVIRNAMRMCCFILSSVAYIQVTQKTGELLKNPTKIEEIQKKKIIDRH